MKRNHYLAAVVLALIMGAAAGCASQQDIELLNNRLMAVEQKTAEARKADQDLTDQVSRSDSELADNQLQIRQRLASMRVSVDEALDKMAEINGRFEETEHVLETRIEALEASERQRQAQKDDLQATLTEIDKRLRTIENYLNFEKEGPNQPAAAGGAGDDHSPPQPANEVELYSVAKKAYDNGDYEQARKLFARLINEYPTSSQADNAQFWIGEAYYKEKWYEKAIVEYNKVIENYPKGNKVPAALLKQGFAFAQIGDNKNARLILRELIKKYPESNEAKIAERKIKRLS